MEFVREALGGQRLGGSNARLVSRVCTDSRRVQPGDLFVALRGERFDGHDFVREAAQAGAAAVVVSRERPLPELPAGCAVIDVSDTRRALGALAARYREDFNLPIVVVGGSNGKTTTKELLASVLVQGRTSEGGQQLVLRSEASFNNDIGVPLTLLELESRHQAAVIEAGTNHPGELAPLLRMIRPRHGILTGIGREHLEYFGDLNGVVQEEGWLAEMLPPEGKLFLNGDGPWAETIAKRCRTKVVRAGLEQHNDWRAEKISVTSAGVEFELNSPEPPFCGPWRLRLLGRHQVINGLLALAVGAELGVTADAAREGLAWCAPPKMRLQLWEGGGVQVLDDSYNANADSTLAALQTLSELPCAGRRLAVLGDMAELGDHSLEAHREVGRRAANCGLSHLFTVGQWAAHTAEAAREAGLSSVTDLPDVAAVGVALRKQVCPGDLILVKASRSSGLDRVADALRRTWAA